VREEAPSADASLSSDIVAARLEDVEAAARRLEEAQPRLTARSLAAGLGLAVLLCGVNSYLTLSFGVIEEGPTIAALFFFAFFFLSKTRITSTEMVMVATMGSAGGSLGFLANFFAAQAMIGTAFGFAQMAAFAVVTSLLGLVFVPALRELLVVREKLPWPGARATERVIRSLVEKGDPRQPWYLLAMGLAAIGYVVANDEDGFGLVPEATALGFLGLAAFGGAVAWSPFALGGSYLLGMRTCVGFLFGGIVLLLMAPALPTPEAPHRYVWPGIGFLVASGLTALAVNWRVVLDALKTIASLRPAGATSEDEAILSPRASLLFGAGALAVTCAFSVFVLHLNLVLVLALVVVGGLIQNLIATRAQAQTAFNPARVMGLLLQGVCALAGGSAATTNLTGAGFVAGSGAQAGNLTGDLAYGRALAVPARWQFWAQTATILPCAVVSAWVFDQLRRTSPMSLEGPGLAAPVAKAWAAAALIFDGTKPMPPFAMRAMLIAAAVGVAYVLLEQRRALRRAMPCSIGLGIGLVLPVKYDLSFFLGGFVMWVVLGRWLGVRSITLTTIAVACIVAEGIGGMLKPLLHLLHFIG
jgi:uncharacterized oligopeptide transporter (OPT) family protein